MLSILWEGRRKQPASLVLPPPEASLVGQGDTMERHVTQDMCRLAQRMVGDQQLERGWQLSGSSLKSRDAMVVREGAQSSHSARAPACVDPQLATLLVSAVGLFQDTVAFG